MRLGWFVTYRPVILSLLLHTVLLVFLIANFKLTPKPVVIPSKDVNIVQATIIDEDQVKAELQRLKQADRKEQKAKEQELEKLKRKAEAEKRKADQARIRRLEEEKKLTVAKKKKELEQQKRKQEQKKLAQLEKEKKELKRQTEIEEQKKQKAEDERKRLEEEEKKRKAEKERKRKQQEEEKLLKEALAAEEKAAQEQADISLIQKIAAEISAKVSSYFNKAGLPDNLTCKLRVRLLPGGNVIDVSVDNSSGNDIFDRRAITAVQKASPLPVPSDVATFERLDLRNIKFTFTP